MPEPEIKLDFCKRDKRMVGYDIITNKAPSTVWYRYYNREYQKQDLSFLIEALPRIRQENQEWQCSICYVYKDATYHTVPISDEEVKQLISPL